MLINKESSPEIFISVETTVGKHLCWGWGGVLSSSRSVQTIQIFLCPSPLKPQQLLQPLQPLSPPPSRRSAVNCERGT